MPKIVLKNIGIFKGFSHASEKNVAGEVVFNTGMVGYPETFTDPSYRGQILVLTYPLIGNYGVPEDKITENLNKYFESNNIHLKGVIVSEVCSKPSHHEAAKTLVQWFKEKDVPLISGIDTRFLTQLIRSKKGTVLGKIIFNKDVAFNDISNLNLVEEVSTKEIIRYNNGKYKICLIDCGVKHNIIRSLLKRNCSVIRIPYDYDFLRNKIDFDGILISNGPGNPDVVQNTVKILKKALAINKPILGICMGNQLLALAAGAKTYKLPFGHRSQNQPCIEVGTKKCYITSQNHSYAIDIKSMPKNWKTWFVNANDGSCEGIKHKLKPFYGVQFHPEATPGPTDTEFIFDLFVEEVKRYCEKAA